MAIKLNAGQKHLLRLIVKDADAEGWTRISKTVFPVLQEMPSELIDLEWVNDEGRARLTPKGQSIIDAMAWL